MRGAPRPFCVTAGTDSYHVEQSGPVSNRPYIDLEIALEQYAAFVCWSSNNEQILVRPSLLATISTFVQLSVVRCVLVRTIACLSAWMRGISGMLCMRARLSGKSLRQAEPSS